MIRSANTSQNLLNKKALAKKKSTGMKYGTIAGLDKQLSRVIYGTLFLHQAESPTQLLDTILAAGCNTFDCAAIYGGGQCEKILGEWISARKIKAEDIVVITKGGEKKVSQQSDPDRARKHGCVAKNSRNASILSAADSH